MDAVVISGKSLDEEEVVQFVAQIESLTGAEVSFEQQWALSSPSESVMNALRMLFSGPAPMPEPVGKVKKAKQTADVSDKPFYSTQTGHEIKVWEVHVPGSGKTTEQIEKITISEKNLRLAAGRFQAGTLLRHPRAGWSRVTGAQGTGQGMTEIDTAEAIRLLEA